VIAQHIKTVRKRCDVKMKAPPSEDDTDQCDAGYAKGAKA